MIELALTTFIVGSLSLLAWLIHWASLELVVAVAVWLTSVGMALGVPTGAWYHVELRRALLARGPLPKRWWLHPVNHHVRLAPEQRFRVLFWFSLGGFGWLLAIAGCVAGAVAVGRVLLGAV